MRNLISWKPIYFHLSLQSGVLAFVLTKTEHSNIENSLSKKLHQEEDEHKGVFFFFLLLTPFLALRSLSVVWFFLLCSYWLRFLLLTESGKQDGKSVESLRQKKEGAEEENSNETWHRGLILSGKSKGCAHGDKLGCPQASHRFKVKYTILWAQDCRKVWKMHSWSWLKKSNLCTWFRWKCSFM